MRHDDVPLQVGEMAMVKVPSIKSIDDSFFRAIRVGICVAYEWEERKEEALMQVFVTGLSAMDEEHRVIAFKGTTTVNDQLVGVEGKISYKAGTGVMYFVRKSKT